MRNLSARQKRALRAHPVRFAYLADIDHPDGRVRLWSGAGELPHDGFVWKGIGALGAIQDVQSTSELRILVTDLILTNVPTEDLVTVNTNVRNRKADISYVLLDERRRVIGDSIPIQSINMEYQSAEVGQDGKSTITIHGTVGLVELRRPTKVAWTPEEQKRRFPAVTDTGFDDVAALVDREVVWRETEI